MSGIYISGLEMPKSCDECCFMYTVGMYANRICLFAADIKESSIRPEDCPLVEVPPHGRLIDADCCEGYFYEHMSDDMMIAAMNAINEMPTIIEREETNG